VTAFFAVFTILYKINLLQNLGQGGQGGQGENLPITYARACFFFFFLYFSFVKKTSDHLDQTRKDGVFTLTICPDQP